MNKVLLFTFILLSSCSHLFYQPTKVLYADPLSGFVLKCDEVWFESKDGTKLYGWWMPAVLEKPKGTIVFFHGNAQNISAHFLNLSWVTAAGYNLFIFDYRGYGASHGRPTQKGVYEDGLSALEKGHEFHKKHSPKGKFIVYGQSLGGVISLRSIADFKYLNEVNLLVQDSTFMSYQNIAFDKLTDHWFTFLFSPLSYLLVSDEYGSYKVINKVNVPALVIVGEQDRHVPAKFGKKIYEELPTKKKWLWTIKEGKHIDVFQIDNYSYREKFLKLLEQ